MAALVQQPVPSAWRFHRLHGYKPGLYTIDVWTNKSYKASFHLDGDVAVMRRVGPHKAIDRMPLDRKAEAMLDALKNELTSGKFALSLPQCTVRQRGIDTPWVYAGAGFISQDAEGNLVLRMFSTEHLDERERFARILPKIHAPGTIVPDSEFYDLAAVDQEGRQWRAERQSIKVIFGFGNEIHMPLQHLEKVETRDKQTSDSGRGWFIPGDIELPWHLYTNTDRCISLDRFEFDDAGFVWKAHKVDGGLDVEFAAKHLSLEPHATRFLRALGMLTGQFMDPLVSYSHSDGQLITCIHRRSTQESTHLLGPMDPRCRDPRDAHRFLACCLQHAERQHPERKDQFLLLYRFWHRILRARHGDIENSSLVLSVAIEGIIKALFASEQDADAEFVELVGVAKPSVEGLKINERVRESLLEHLKYAVFPKPKETMRRLKEQGVVTDAHIRAWNQMRNSGAHGAQLEDDAKEIEEHYQRYLCCLDMFYRLLFLAINYQGKYIDRSLAGWPLSNFPPTDNDASALDSDAVANDGS